MLSLRGEDQYTFFCLSIFCLRRELYIIHHSWLDISSEVNFAEVTGAFGFCTFLFMTPL